MAARRQRDDHEHLPDALIRKREKDTVGVAGKQHNKSTLRLEKDIAKAIFLHRYTAEEAFKNFDLDQNGHLSRNEFLTGVHKLMEKNPLTVAQEHEVWAAADYDGTGYIDMAEFMGRFRVTCKFEGHLRNDYNTSALHIEHLESIQGLMGELMRGEEGDLRELFLTHKDGMVTKEEFSEHVHKLYEAEIKVAERDGRVSKEWMEQHKLGIRQSDVDKLYALVDEHFGKIDILEFKSMLSLVDMRAKYAALPTDMHRYSFKLELDHKKCRYQQMKKVRPLPKGDGHLRCSDLHRFTEDLLAKQLGARHANFKLVRKTDRSVSRGLEGMLERVVDLCELANPNNQGQMHFKGQGFGAKLALYFTFFVSYYGATYYTSLYHGRAELDATNEKLINFSFKAVLTKEDYLEVSRVPTLPFADWPEFSIVDDGWTVALCMHACASVASSILIIFLVLRLQLPRHP
jgi:Ca2+-binding EF-hand superfamily protein